MDTTHGLTGNVGAGPVEARPGGQGLDIASLLGVNARHSSMTNSHHGSHILELDQLIRS
jgi:hypothetical protein